MAVAFSLALGRMEIPNEWYQYLTDTPEEAADLRRHRTVEAMTKRAAAKLAQ